jgi:PhzF family phenazine biosynthesis protein
MNLPFYQVDAFTDRLFSGNPAGVCPLAGWLTDELLQSIAAENNLAETAFFVPGEEGFELRWFTPEVEVDLCGHATLAAAHVLFLHLGQPGEVVRFQTRSGILEVSREGDLLALDFPARPAISCECPDDLAAGLGRRPVATAKARDYFAIFETEEEIRSLRPDMEVLSRLECLGIIATAPGKDCDFVSRFFAPGAGVPEDPVTGSAHCTLIPYWAKRLGKTKLHARQLSRRGGELWCEDLGARVRMSGRAVTYLTGFLHLP